MYSFKTQEDKPGEVKLSTYIADMDAERYYVDVITGLPQGSYVASLNFSPKTNVVYLNIKVGDNIAYLYKYDIMDFLFWIANTTPDMVIKQTYLTDHYIYSPYSGTLTVRNGYTGAQYDYYFENDVHILGSDFKDNIYFGLLNDEGRIYEVKFGKYDEGNSQVWNTISLKTPAEKKDLFFSMDKKPYYIDRQNNVIVDLINDIKTSFSAEEEVIEILAEKYGIKDKSQIMHRWKRSTMKFRRVAAYILTTYCGMTLKEVCKYMYNITASCCSMLSNKGFEIVHENEEIRSLVAGL
jgi:hypothetical protein